MTPEKMGMHQLSARHPGNDCKKSAHSEAMILCKIIGSTT